MVQFESDSCLENIEEYCFSRCGIGEVVIPKSVTSIKDLAFYNCLNLSLFSFEQGSQICSLGTGVFANTKLTRKRVQYPSTLKTDGLEYVTASMIDSYKRGYKGGYDTGKKDRDNDC